ncbi:diacylglycerol kinase family lipid kinase [candidate division KSB1 bacterium]|nr:diacylglycerol kinase family lipid kinase [candidate division KSB1 bacterium]
MGKGKRIKFIFNPRAGFLHPVNYILSVIGHYFPCNLCEYDFEHTQFRGHATEIASRAVAEEYDIIIGIGGDGTIHQIASVLVGTDIPLGIIPTGSGNGLARCLGIPLLINKALKLVTTGDIIPIDVGIANGKHFFVTSGFGFDAVVGKRFDDSALRGPAPYFYVGLTEFIKYKKQHYTITFNNHKINVKALLVAVVNSKQYGVNAIIAPAAKIDDGVLDLCIIKSASFLQTFLHLPKLFTGQIEKAPIVELHQGKEFLIEKNEGNYYHLDGEIYESDSNSIRVSIIPKSLNVIVNRKVSQS